ncbi:MAG: DUF190 domain-containing protein [Longimicrobiales bacterium]
MPVHSSRSTRGIAGLGAHSRIHTDKILRLSLDLPARR